MEQTLTEEQKHQNTLDKKKIWYQKHKDEHKARALRRYYDKQEQIRAYQNERNRLMRERLSQLEAEVKELRKMTNNVTD
jgi:hypothetical protein